MSSPLRLRDRQGGVAVPSAPNQLKSSKFADCPAIIFREDCFALSYDQFPIIPGIKALVRAITVTAVDEVVSAPQFGQRLWDKMRLNKLTRVSRKFTNTIRHI